MDFSERLKLLRNNVNVTQSNLAKQLNVTDRVIRMYEAGKSEPGMSTLIALADYFGVSLDYLVGRSDVPHVAKEESK